MKKVKRRILCVDDDRDTCEMLSLLLGKAGYEVSCATTVSKGLTLAQKDSCDLILLDYYFQDGTGVELCQMIRAFDSNTPILFYSGAAYEADIEQARDAGAQGYLVKPCGIEKLERAVTLLLSRKNLEESKKQSEELIATSRQLIKESKKKINAFRQSSC